MIERARANAILADLEASPYSGARLRQEAMQMLDTLPTYDWSGIYRLESNQLVLDEFVGAPTDHTHIPVGVGVCGTAVAEDRNQVIEDVNKLDNYLACSLTTRSEIVVLIKKDGRTLGQIDIDSHTVGAFDQSDERFLERLAELLAQRW